MKLEPGKRSSFPRVWLEQEISGIKSEIDILKQVLADYRQLRHAAGMDVVIGKTHEKKGTRVESVVVQPAEPKAIYMQKTMDQALFNAQPPAKVETGREKGSPEELPLKRKRQKSSLFDSSRSDFVTEPIERETTRSKKKKSSKSEYKQLQLNFKSTAKKQE